MGPPPAPAAAPRLARNPRRAGQEADSLQQLAAASSRPTRARGSRQASASSSSAGPSGFTRCVLAPALLLPMAMPWYLLRAAHAGLSLSVLAASACLDLLVTAAQVRAITGGGEIGSAAAGGRAQAAGRAGASRPSAGA
jgi:hypothetical protein